MVLDNRVGMPHEYGPSTVGHGESQCVHCHGTNRENAVIAPNHCETRANKQPGEVQALQSNGETLWL
jgi:hypothetical protein